MAGELTPMLAIPSTGAGNRQPIDVRTLVATGDWALDLKLDGIRAMWHRGRMSNRLGADVTSKFPEISMPDRRDGFPWLDGEIVALDGRFETVARREKLEKPAHIAQAAVANPCRFVAFDVIPADRQDRWDTRRARLELVQEEYGLPITPVGYDVDFMDQVRELRMEGVIAKRLASRYKFNRRSSDWVKHKFTQRISCLVAGYEPGNGSREHFGAMYLAVLDADGNAVPVGKVGSGFTDRETHELKRIIDAKREVLIVEIEALSLTSGGTLRFPVYRGTRRDILPTDCTTAQLDSLPRS